MALHTLRRGSSKNTLHVAPLAHDLCVAAAEGEAGAAVVEFHVGTIHAILGLCLAWQHDAKPQDHCDENPTHHSPITQRAMWSVSVHRYANPYRFLRAQRP